MNLREVRDRIASVKSTQKITSAMKLVSSAKLRRAQSAVEGMLPYSNRLNALLASFLQGTNGVISPFATVRQCKKVVLIAVSSNTGLCGTFNANIANMLRDVVRSYEANGTEMEIYTIGKKVFDATKKLGYTPNEELMAQATTPQYGDVANVVRALMERFVAGEIDRVEVVHPHFRSAAKQESVCDVLMPIDLAAASDKVTLETDYIVEPSREELLSALVPKVIEVRLFAALLDSVAAEHAARVLAMQVATDNASDLISELTLEYNKGRQQAITNELLDIVSGSEANR
ncbi:MAG: ATP synthase F1 subunit gamma [Bacteroidaceae bacterium]|nr:ATP synthase F1 subunit gamma [Bacteroidaceae bacterium]